MSFQQGKKKSLSDRFANISPAQCGQHINNINNRDLIQRFNTDSQLPKKTTKAERVDHRYNNDLAQGKTGEARDTGTLTVHLKINQNRNRNANNYVNRPNRPLNLQCRDKPSELTKHFSREGVNGTRDNFQQKFSYNLSQQNSSVDTSNYSQSQKFHHSSQRYNQNDRPSNAFRENLNGQTSPRFNQSMSSRYNHSAQNTSPKFNQSSQSTSPKFNQSVLSADPRLNQSVQNTDPQFNQQVQSKPRFDQRVQSTLPRFDQSVQSPTPRFNQHFQGTSPRFDQIGHSTDSKLNEHVAKTSPNGQYANEQQCRVKSPLMSKSPGSSQSSCNPYYPNNSQSSHQTTQWNNMCQNNDIIEKQWNHVNENHFNTPDQSHSQIGQASNQDRQNCSKAVFPNRMLPEYSNKLIQNNFTSPCNAIHQNNIDCSNQADFRNNFNGNSYQSQSFQNNNTFADRFKATFHSTQLSKVPEASKPYGNDIPTPTGNSHLHNYSSVAGLSNNLIQATSVSKEDSLNSLSQSTGLPQNGEASPTFSSDSNMSLDSEADQCKENVKPTGYYTDLSKEVFPEVEALKKKFFQECDSLTSTAEDKQIVHVVKNILQTTTDLAAVCGNSKHSQKKELSGMEKSDTMSEDSKLVIDENHKETEDSMASSQHGNSSARSPVHDDGWNSEMKFEGRTLLKGGVKPRHISKICREKPGFGPPTDRRVRYMTVRNLFDLPLPRWASGKGVYDHDISDGINKERQPDMTDKESKKHTNSERKEENVQTTKDIPTLSNANKGAKASDSNNTIENNCSNPNSVDKQSSNSASKYKMTSKENTSIANTANKKMKTEVKKIDMTIGSLISKKKETSVKESQKDKPSQQVAKVTPSGSKKTLTTSNKETKSYNQRDKSSSRESSRSRRSRSRSRNRSRSRERRNWRNKQSESHYRRSDYDDYRSRSRDSRRRSPVKRPFSTSQNSTKSLMDSITLKYAPSKKNLNMYDSDRKNVDLYGSDRNELRNNYDFNFADSR